MTGYRKKIWKLIFLSGLMFSLVSVCVGTGCSKGLLGKRVEPGKTWICDEKADQAMMGYDYEISISLHERFLEKEPVNALAFYHLGYGYGQTGDHLKEVFHYEKAIALGLKANRIFFNLGMAYGELNETEKSVAAFKKALETNPASSDNHFGLAMAYYQGGFNDKLVIQEFLKAIKIDPRHVDARLYLSIFYADKGELEKASEQLQRILEIDPTHRKAGELLERIKKE